MAEERSSMTGIYSMKLLNSVLIRITMLLCSFASALFIGYIFADLCSGKNEPVVVLIILALLVLMPILSIMLMITAALLED
jgi:ABC-type glycerol-3-phosphate transport system permease component